MSKHDIDIEEIDSIMKIPVHRIKGEPPRRFRKNLKKLFMDHFDEVEEIEDFYTQY